MKIRIEYNSLKESEVLSVLEANYLGDFAMRVLFSNNQEVLVDFKPFLQQSKNPSISKYLNENLFASFTIEEGNLNWNDYELCFPIDDLYNNQILKPASTASLN